MKKLILFFVGALIGLPQVQAQTIDLGVKAGVNFANIDGDTEFDFKGKTGYHAGLVAEVLFSERFSLQPEFLYSAQGAKMELSGNELGIPYSFESTISIDYIDIPVLMKYYVIEGLSLELGPQVGFLVRGEQEYDISIGGDTESGTQDIKDDLKSTIFGLAAGLGYKINDGLMLNGRYILGLSNIQKEDESFDEENIGDISLKNYVLQFSIGYMF